VEFRSLWRRILPAPSELQAKLGAVRSPNVPTIEFEGSAIGEPKTVEEPEGGALVDICDEHYAPVAFSCRSASCATCHIEVVAGAHLLEPPEEPERELLELIGAPEGSRLACQARVRPGPGVLRIRPILG
jgi:ferredoxin